MHACAVSVHVANVYYATKGSVGAELVLALDLLRRHIEVLQQFFLHEVVQNLELCREGGY